MRCRLTRRMSRRSLRLRGSAAQGVIPTDDESARTGSDRGRTLLARPENDYSWSSWADAGAAVREIDELISRVQAGKIPRLTLEVIFAATGPMQEVSLSSGWAEAFLKLAERFDAALPADAENG